jgi:putative transposase
MSSPRTVRTRLMRQAAIQGIYRRRGRKNLVSAATEEDLVRRNFDADWPGALWLTDITEHPTGEGKLYCAAAVAASAAFMTTGATASLT